MEEAKALIGAGLESWRALPLGEIERKLVVALLIGALFYVLVLAIEGACRTRTSNYRSREFLHDAAFWFYYRSGVHWILFMSLAFTWLDQFKTPLDLNLLVDYPMWVRAIAFLLVAEFIGYWWHRANHTFKFLWAFHSMHHAPRKLTFAASARFHPVELFIQYCWFYVLMRILGGSPLAWLPVLIMLELVLEWQHTQIPWRLGPFYKVLVTPTYHEYHHSADPAHFNKNFAVIFSCFDYLFGTAVPDGSPRPKKLGLPDVEMPTLASSIFTPFRLAFESYGTTGRAAQPPADLIAQADAGPRS